MYLYADEILALDKLYIDIMPIEAKQVAAVYPSIAEAWDKYGIGWQVVEYKGKHFRARSYRKPEE